MIRAYWSKCRVETNGSTNGSFQNHSNSLRDSHYMVLPQTFPYNVELIARKTYYRLQIKTTYTHEQRCCHLTEGNKFSRSLNSELTGFAWWRARNWQTRLVISQNLFYCLDCEDILPNFSKDFWNRSVTEVVFVLKRSQLLGLFAWYFTLIGST